jgi:hypothetical protein
MLRTVLHVAFKSALLWTWARRANPGQSGQRRMAETFCLSPLGVACPAAQRIPFVMHMSPSQRQAPKSFTSRP